MAVAVVVIHLEVDHLNNSGNGGLEGDDPPVRGQPGLHYSRVKEPAHAFMVILAILTHLKRLSFLLVRLDIKITPKGLSEVPLNRNEMESNRCFYPTGKGLVHTPNPAKVKQTCGIQNQGFTPRTRKTTGDLRAFALDRSMTQPHN